MQLDDIRQRFVDAALELVGLGANPADADTRQRFLDLVAPGETPERQAEMIGKSTCGFIVAAIWRLVGIEHALLAHPYVDRTAISRLMTIGKQAWIPYVHGRIPQLGDAVLVGDNTAANGVEHVYTVVATQELPEVLLHSVDGGQRDKKQFQQVHAKTHAWRGGRDFSFEGEDPGANTTNGRKIMGWFDAVLLSTLIPESTNATNEAPDDRPDYREAR